MTQEEKERWLGARILQDVTVKIGQDPVVTGRLTSRPVGGNNLYQVTGKAADAFHVFWAYEIRSIDQETNTIRVW